MQSFKKFLEEAKFNKGTIITAEPVHGGHSRPSKPKIITVEPVHGGHSRPPQKIKEENYDNFLRPKYDHLDDDGNQHASNFFHKNHNDHIGADIDVVHSALNSSEEDFHSLPHSSALKEYSSGSWDTNHELLKKATGKRSSFEPNDFDSEQDKKNKKWKSDLHNRHIDSLDASFHHPSAVLKQDVHVFHGTNKFNPGEEAKKGGGSITLPSYISTSIAPRIASGFAGRYGDGHIIHIHLKKGQRAKYLGTNSAFDHEKEMLLPRNSTIQIHPTPTVVHHGDGAKTHIWHGHIVSETQPAPHKDNTDKK